MWGCWDQWTQCVAVAVSVFEVTTVVTPLVPLGPSSTPLFRQYSDLLTPLFRQLDLPSPERQKHWRALELKERGWGGRAGKWRCWQHRGVDSDMGLSGVGASTVTMVGDAGIDWYMLLQVQQPITVQMTDVVSNIRGLILCKIVKRVRGSSSGLFDT